MATEEYENKKSSNIYRRKEIGQAHREREQKQPIGIQSQLRYKQRQIIVALNLFSGIIFIHIIPMQEQSLLPFFFFISPRPCGRSSSRRLPFVGCWMRASEQQVGYIANLMPGSNGIIWEMRLCTTLTLYFLFFFTWNQRISSFESFSNPTSKIYKISKSNKYL